MAMVRRYGACRQLYKYDRHKHQCTAGLVAVGIYGKPIDTTSVDTYASLRAPQQYAEAANDPFALEELRTTYRKELEQAVAKADFNKVFVCVPR